MASKALHITQYLFGNLCRFLLAVVFLFSGITKGIDPHGTQYKIGDYLVSFGLGGWYPEEFPLAMGMVLAALEFSVGLFLFCGVYRRFSTWMSLLIMCAMTPLTLYIALVNPVTDCGCFGDVLVISNWQTFIKNIILLIAACTLVIWRKHKIIRLISKKMRWLVCLYGLFFIFSLEVYSLYRLPIADFTVYRNGTNIPENMIIPEGAEEPEYDSTFIMEKDGKQQEFTLENYPDSTWNYVDTKTVQIKAGYVPPIHDFVLQDVETGDDVTEEILFDDRYIFLLVAYDLPKAEQGMFDQINDLYDYCLANDYGFYALTASGEDAISTWKYETGAEYPFCSADGTMLKTMVRSNPGLVLIKKGTVINKWSRNDLPTAALTARIESLHLDNSAESQPSRLGGLVFVFLALPLLLITVLDRVWAGFRLMVLKIKRKTRIANLLKEKEK